MRFFHQIGSYSVSALLLSFALLWGCGAPTESNTTLPRPNILIAISDDQSFEHTSFAGCRFVNTPSFDRVARSGIYFANCMSGSPGCAPSRSALITGRHHWQNEQSGQHAAGWHIKHIPIVDVLRDNGYHVGMTGKGVAPFRYARDESDSLLRMENAAGPGFYEHRYGEEYDPRPASGIGSVNYAANFKDFLSRRNGEKPFYFWYGASEPHRRFEFQSGSKQGKRLADVQVPGFLPDVDTIREDLLDYALEIEWFDMHLGRMLDMLDSLGELDNTLVIVTSDNGMAFPRAKANAYEYGIHVPMAMSLPSRFEGGRTIAQPVGFVDVVPTLLELLAIEEHTMLPVSGSSLLPGLQSEDETMGAYAFSGRERHSSTRWRNYGYPQRAIRSDQHLLIWNMKPERAPAGVAVMLDNETGEAYPTYGLENGRYLPGTVYHDIDDCPTKTFMIENREQTDFAHFQAWAVGHRPEYELYDVVEDPFCLRNLAGEASASEVLGRFSLELQKELTSTLDPRVVGPDKEIFDSYPRYSPMRRFPPPDWAK